MLPENTDMSLNLGKSDVDLKKDYEDAVVSGKKNQKKIVAILLINILVIIIGIPVIIAYFTYQSYVSHQRISNGSRIVATLDNKYTEVRRTVRAGTRYDVSYSFRVDGETYTGTTSMPNKPISKSIVVLYDPENPNNNKVEGGEDSFESLFIGIAGVLILSAGFSLFAWATKKVSSKRTKAK